MESNIEYITDEDYRNLSMDFSPLPENAAFMPAVFEVQEQKVSTADLINDLLA